jgi:hypothetical protein
MNLIQKIGDLFFFALLRWCYVAYLQWLSEHRGVPSDARKGVVMTMFYYRLPTLGLSWGTIPCAVPLRANALPPKILNFRVAL